MRSTKREFQKNKKLYLPESCISASANNGPGHWENEEVVESVHSQMR